jgi:hypothetical protein
MMMFIPEIGDEITLKADWTFDLHWESRNEDIIRWAGILKDTEAFSWSYSEDRYKYGQKCGTATLPAGTVLKVDRIYIRKGGPDFSSLTFFVKSLPNAEVSTTRLAHKIVDTDEPWQPAPHNPKVMVKPYKHVYTPAKKSRIRFWAKLKDVNKIEF